MGTIIIRFANSFVKYAPGKFLKGTSSLRQWLALHVHQGDPDKDYVCHRIGVLCSHRACPSSREGAQCTLSARVAAL